MGFSCGIVGLPNAGKSSLLCALGGRAEVAPYPFTTIDKNIGMAPVKDDRLSKIAEIARPRKVVPAAVQFRDIAGLVKGASKGEGLGNQFLGHVRETDALVHVIRCFEEQDVPHVYGSVDPRRDAEIVNAEMLLSDLATIERRFAKATLALKAHTHEARVEVSALTWLKEILSRGINLSSAFEKTRFSKDGQVRSARALPLLPESSQEVAARALCLTNDMGLLTAKPTFYLANVSEEYADEPDSAPGARLVQEMAEEQGLPCVSISVKIEAEINELSEEEAETFRKEMGLPSSLLDRVVSLGYKLLNLITFFTVNENEARAWPIRSGLTAYEAAGKIHSDMQRGFVKAEVTDSGDLFRAGSFARARELGYTRLEGKEYEVRDGDILYIRFA